MTKFEAKRLLKELEITRSSLNKLAEIANSLENQEDRKYFVKEIGSIVGSINSEIILTICEQFPDLNPYKK